jgi:hypothetical protein
LQICNRHFSRQDLEWIRLTVESRPDLSRYKLSRLFCRHVDWQKADGGLKDMSCRVAMLRLEQNGLIRLPARKQEPVCSKRIKPSDFKPPQADIHFQAGRVELEFEVVERKTAAVYNELIDRYHYLGYRRMGGAQMRFFVRADGQLIALLGFSAAAWKVGPRDEFIGWTAAQRKKRLHLVVDNSRFLLLPWVHGKNLASQILSVAARKLPAFWQQRYNYKPLLLESFVEKQRFAGTCYKAANWICVGQTQGRGKWDRHHGCEKPVKTIWLHPLDRRFKEALCR